MKQALPFLLLAVAVGGVWLGTRGPGDESPAKPGATPIHSEPDPALALGAEYFRQALDYVTGQAPPHDEVQTLHADLDAKLESDWFREELRIEHRFRFPDRFREQATGTRGTSTRILNGDRAWVRHPGGAWEALHDATDEFERLRDDRRHFADLWSCVTLQPLGGEDVAFRFEGYKRGSGTFAGWWLKITRAEPGQPGCSIWLAYERLGENVVRATWPGVVRFHGDAERGVPTVDYLLKDWTAPDDERREGPRYPLRVEAYSHRQDEMGRRIPSRFLFAIVMDFRTNVSVPEHLFEPGP